MFQMEIVFVLLPLLTQFCSCKTLGASDRQLLKTLFSKDKMQEFLVTMHETHGKAVDPYIFGKDVSFLVEPKENMKLHFTILKDTQIRGISKFVLDSVAVDEKSSTVRLRASVPSIEVDGFYRINGSVAIRVFIRSEGKMFIKMVSPQAKIKVSMGRSRDGSFLEAKRVKMNMSIGKVDIKLQHLTDKNSSMINSFIRAATGSLFEKRVKPFLLPIMENILKTNLNQFLKQNQ